MGKKVKIAILCLPNVQEIFFGYVWEIIGMCMCVCGGGGGRGSEWPITALLKTKEIISMKVYSNQLLVRTIQKTFDISQPTRF